MVSHAAAPEIFGGRKTIGRVHMLDENVSARGANPTTVEGTAITYAIPDIHGRLDLLVKAIDRIVADVLARGWPPYKIVFLGDYIDRGPESALVVGSVRVMAVCRPNPLKLLNCVAVSADR